VAEGRERWDRENEAEAQREHELALIKAKSEADRSEWAVTARYVFIWALIIAGVCYLEFIDRL